MRESAVIVQIANNSQKLYIREFQSSTKREVEKSSAVQCTMGHFVGLKPLQTIFKRHVNGENDNKCTLKCSKKLPGLECL